MIDLQPFCSHDRRQTTMCAPFSIGGYSYATNGIIAVRVPRRASAKPCDNQRLFADVPAAFAERADDTWRSFAVDIPPLPAATCSQCNGLGFCALCTACVGSGKHNCGCTHCTAACDYCLGSGAGVTTLALPHAERIGCSKCEGTGRTLDHRYMLIEPNLSLALRYVGLIMALPGPIRFARRANNDVQLFSFDGGLVALMPRTYSTTDLHAVVVSHCRRRHD